MLTWEPCNCISHSRPSGGLLEDALNHESRNLFLGDAGSRWSWVKTRPPPDGPTLPAVSWWDWKRELLTRSTRSLDKFHLKYVIFTPVANACCSPDSRDQAFPIILISFCKLTLHQKHGCGPLILKNWIKTFSISKEKKCSVSIFHQQKIKFLCLCSFNK